MTLAIPKLRHDTHLPEWLLAPWRRRRRTVANMTALQARVLTWRRSNSIIGCALAVLVVFERIVVSRHLDGGLRYGVEGTIVVALLLGVAQLSSNRRER